MFTPDLPTPSFPTRTSLTKIGFFPPSMLACALSMLTAQWNTRLDRLLSADYVLICDHCVMGLLTKLFVLYTKDSINLHDVVSAATNRRLVISITST